MVKDSKVQALKAKLDEVSLGSTLAWASEGEGKKKIWEERMGIISIGSGQNGLYGWGVRRVVERISMRGA